MSGFIALHRGPNTDALRKDRNAFLLLSLIADRARWRDDPCKVHGLRKGQALLGKGDCQAIGLPEKHRGQLRGALKRLERFGFVTTKGTTRGTVVTLADQSVFSITANQPTTPTTIDQPSTDQRPAIKEPSTDQRPTTKNKETINKETETRNTPPKSPKGDSEALVDKLWEVSPRMARNRSSKKQVAEAWKNTKPGERPAGSDLILAMEAWSECDNWAKDKGEYIPGLHHWIKNQKWESPPERKKAKPETLYGRGAGHVINFSENTKESHPLNSDETEALLLKLWEVSPQKARSISSKTQVAEAWGKIETGERPAGSYLISAMEAWSKCGDWIKDEGQNIPSLHFWIEYQKWESAPGGKKANSETLYGRGAGHGITFT